MVLEECPGEREPACPAGHMALPPPSLSLSGTESSRSSHKAAASQRRVPERRAEKPSFLTHPWLAARLRDARAVPCGTLSTTLVVTPAAVLAGETGDCFFK